MLKDLIVLSTYLILKFEVLIFDFEVLKLVVFVLTLYFCAMNEAGISN